MEYQDGNVNLLHIENARKAKGTTKSLWWNIAAFSAVAILGIVMVVMITEVRTTQSNNMATTSQLQADLLQLYNKSVAMKAKLQDALIEQGKITQQQSQAQFQQLSKEFGLRLHSNISALQAKLQDALTEQNNITRQESKTQLEQIVKEIEQMYQSFGNRDCKDLLDEGMTQDGVYTIYAGDKPINVWCDMSTGGSIVLMKRFDGSQNFTKTFQEYSDGFGDLAAEHWLGLSNMHRITATGNWILRIDMEHFDNQTAYTEHSNFRIDCGSGFALQVNKSSYRGTAGDNLSYFKGMRFSTFDKDQDTWGSGSCSLTYGKSGGWWYKRCQHGLFTGMPYNGTNSIYWKAWKGKEVLKAVSMKIRRH